MRSRKIKGGDNVILRITQTASNIKQTYDIFGEDFFGQGNVGNFSRMQAISLSWKENTIRGVFRISKWVNYIPYRYLFGKANLTRGFVLYKNDTEYGSIVFSRHGYHRSFYVITLNSGETFYCYYRAKGAFVYVSVYQGDTQIALIETYLSVNDFKYTHKLYLLDDNARFADALSFFVLYFANYRFTNRFHMTKGSITERVWSFSKYNDRYDPKWREIHFPNENFFG